MRVALAVTLVTLLLGAALAQDAVTARSTASTTAGAGETAVQRQSVVATPANTTEDEAAMTEVDEDNEDEEVPVLPVGEDEDEELAENDEGVDVEALQEEQAGEDPCACTILGISGSTQVGGRRGCREHVPGVVFCYVVDPDDCILSTPSEAFPGAAWRYCDPVFEPASAYDTVWDAVQEEPELSVLRTAVEAANLTGLLNSTEVEVTLFAPTNDAWEKALPALGVTPDSLEDFDQLLPVLTLHVAPGALTSDELAYPSNEEVETFSVATPPANYIQLESISPRSFFLGPFLTLTSRMVGRERLIIQERVYDVRGFRLAPGVPKQAIGAQANAELIAGNGVVHLIDGVIALPLDVSTVIRIAPQLSTFWTALNATGLADRLGGDGECPNARGRCRLQPVTVFAPSNGAFRRLANNLNMPVRDLIDSPVMRDILEYHISDPDQADIMSFRGIENETTVPTLLEGEQLRVYQEPVQERFEGFIFFNLEIGTTELFVEGDTNRAEIIGPDSLRGYNGVINVIDQVLIPSSVSMREGSSGMNATENAPSTQSDEDSPTNLNNFRRLLHA